MVCQEKAWHSSFDLRIQSTQNDSALLLDAYPFIHPILNLFTSSQ